MERASVKLAFHSVWGNKGFVCPALTAETISQLSPKVFPSNSTSSPPVLWKPLPHSQANQRQPSHSQALHIPLLHWGSAAPQNLQWCSAPPALPTGTPLSSSAWHSHLAAHSTLLSSAIPRAGLHHSFPWWVLGEGLGSCWVFSTPQNPTAGW